MTIIDIQRPKRKYTVIAPPSNKHSPLEARFWAKVDKRGPNDCWPWLAALDKDGYGFMNGGQVNGKQVTVRAARVAYELEYGPLPPGIFALHECDHRDCCNARHLKAGTPKQNAHDAAIRGRLTRKLTDAQVMEIIELRESGLTLAKLAKQFGVSSTTISSIVRGKTYSWLTGVGLDQERKAA
jgi:hypothetical protein